MTRWAWIAVGGSLGLAAILTIALVVAIASGGDDEDPVPTQTAPTAPQTFGGPLGGGVSPEAEACLSKQGVEPPGSSGEIPSDGDIERLREALKECGLPAPHIVTPGS